MPNGVTHSLVGGLSGLAVAALDKGENQHNSSVAIGTGVLFGKLPDILEPSFRNPHHRQFFHSFVMVGIVGCGTKKIYDWEPQNQLETAIRNITLCAGVGFLCHLILDAMTARSLPIFGKI